MSNKSKFGLAILIVILAAASRLVKHPFNFTPIVAMSIFGGSYLHKRWAVMIPLAAMALSDIILYSTNYGWSYFDWKTTLSIYFSLCLAFLIGWYLTRRKKWYAIIGAGVLSSIIFFIITNFAVWAFFNWYPHTLAGLENCFTLALHFFRNSLAGDAVYTLAFFGAYELAARFLNYRFRMGSEINE
jgi:hypothetical protein